MTEKVLIIGAGISGLLAARQLGECGVHCIVVEQRPVVGGRAAALLDPNAGADDPADSQSAKLLAQLRAMPLPGNSQILTLCELLEVDAQPHGYRVSLKQHPRFVSDDCTRCNHCSSACPQVVGNEYDLGLTVRKAIHSPFPHAFPAAFAVDIETCLNVPPNYLPCQRCVEVCDDHAIDFSNARETSLTVDVDAIMLAVGDSAADLAAVSELGYGRHPDCVTSDELQRMLENPGPSGGFAIRPSNEDYPDSVLLVLERVSDYVCQLFQQQLRQLATQDIGRIDLLILEQQATGEAIEALRASAESLGVAVSHAAWLGIKAADQVELNYLDFASNQSRLGHYDLVVFALDRQAGTELTRMTEMLNIACDARAYPTLSASASVSELEEATEARVNAGASSKPGIFVIGSAAGCSGLQQTLQQTQSAVTSMLNYLHPGVAVSAANQAGSAAGATALQFNQQQLEQILHGLIRLGEGGSG